MGYPILDRAPKGRTRAMTTGRLGFAATMSMGSLARLHDTMAVGISSQTSTRRSTSCNRLGFHVDIPLAPGFVGLARVTCGCFSTSPVQVARARLVEFQSLGLESVPDRRCRSRRGR